MDIFLNKETLENQTAFDFLLEQNDLKRDDTYVTASIISIFTDASQPQIGTQIDGKTIGNSEYNIQKMDEDSIKNFNQGLKEAVQWLIDDGIVSDIKITTQKQSSLLKVQITFQTAPQNSTNLIFSLDQNLAII